MPPGRCALAVIRLPAGYGRVRLGRMIDELQLRSLLSDHWGLDGAEVEPHHGGMNSATWFVTHGGRRWVAKAVAAHNGPSFTAGMAVAEHLDEAGIAAGRPERSRIDGRAVVQVDGVPLALLRWVDGNPLRSAGPAEQALMGTMLALTHQALRGFDVDGAIGWHWVEPDAAHLDLEPSIRKHVTAAAAALDAIDTGALTFGLLHADPAPEAFRLDPDTAACGLIDWVGQRGPLLYDLASALMYCGGPGRGDQLVKAYVSQGVVTAAEVELGLAALLRFRWAAQADYFARRIAEDDLTGIADRSGNDKGLNDARHWLNMLSE